MVFMVLHWHDHCIYRVDIFMPPIIVGTLIDVVFMGIALFIIYDILLHTDYTIRGERLHIRCGFIFRMNLPISKISEIRHKSTILSSPALSAKRIGLRYGNKNWVFVSPKNQEEFISALRSIHPEIKIS